MMTGSQIMRNQVSAGATARLNGGYTEHGLDGVAERDLGNWLHQVAGKISLAISRRIPVGFEDETGFYLGVQPVREQDHMYRERSGIFADDEHF